MDAQDMILDDITRKQLIWYGHVERMDPTRLPKIMIHWKPEGRKKTRPSPENLERWNIYSHEWKRSKNGRMGQSKAMEYESRKASSDVFKPCNIYNKNHVHFRPSRRKSTKGFIHKPSELDALSSPQKTQVCFKILLWESAEKLTFKLD